MADDQTRRGDDPGHAGRVARQHRRRFFRVSNPAGDPLGLERQPEDHQPRKKKVRETIREPTGAEFMLRCAELNLSDEALRGMTMGMVYDMLTERANDREDYPIRATQADIEAYFGGG